MDPHNLENLNQAKHIPVVSRVPPKKLEANRSRASGVLIGHTKVKQTNKDYKILIKSIEQIVLLGCELQRIMKGHENPVHLLFPFGPKLISVDLKSLLKVYIFFIFKLFILSFAISFIHSV